MYFLVSGYKDIGPVDFGHYMQSYSYNQYEGNRFRLGFRTNAKFSKNWIVRGYGAYGTKDKGFKYSLQLERILTRFPWSTAGIQYRDDIDQVGLNFNGNSNLNLGESPNNLYNTFSQIGNISRLVRKQEAKIWYEKSFNIGLNTKIVFQNTRTHPLFPITLGDQFTVFQQQNFDVLVLEKIGLKGKTLNGEFKPWRSLVKEIHTERTEKVSVGIIAKYISTGAFELTDSYHSLLESLHHAAWHNKVELEIVFINAEKLEKKDKDAQKMLKSVDGIIVPIGWGSRGVEGKKLGGAAPGSFRQGYDEWRCPIF